MGNKNQGIINKGLFCIIIVLLTIVSAILIQPQPPTKVFAEDSNIILNGFCGNEEVNNGENVTWALTFNEGTTEDETDYVLTIGGAGAMADFNLAVDPWWIETPWHQAVGNNITSLVFDDESLITYIGAGSFNEMTNLCVDVILPDSVTDIGAGAFRKSGITSIDLNKVTTLTESAIVGMCPNLVSVDLGDIKTITGSNSFRDCENIATLTSENLEVIGGTYNFYNNSSLTIVNMPKLKSIGQATFCGSSNLVAFITGSTIVSIEKNALQSIHDPSVIYVIDEESANVLLNPNVSLAVNVSAIAIMGDWTFADNEEFTADTIAQLNREGYIFDGWYKKDVEGNYSDKITIPTALEKYYPKWTCETPTISGTIENNTILSGEDSQKMKITTSVSDGGTLSYQWYSSLINENTGGTTIQGATAAEYTATNCTETKYYYCEVKNSKTDSELTYEETVTSETVTVTVVPKHTITFDIGDNATLETTTATTNIETKLATLPIPVSTEGNTFVGWFDVESGGNEITTSTVFSEDATIYAQWETIETAKIEAITELTTGVTDDTIKTAITDIINSATTENLYAIKKQAEFLKDAEVATVHANQAESNDIAITLASNSTATNAIVKESISTEAQTVYNAELGDYDITDDVFTLKFATASALSQNEKAMIVISNFVGSEDLEYKVAHIKDLGFATQAIEYLPAEFDEDAQTLTFEINGTSPFAVVSKAKTVASKPALFTAPLSVDSEAPTIAVNGNIATITDENLATITIDGEEIAVTADKMEIDLTSYGNGEHKIVATDKFGKETSETVQVTIEEKPTVTPTPTTKPEVTEKPTVTPEPTQNAKSGALVWIILGVLAISGVGFAIYKKRK